MTVNRTPASVPMAPSSTTTPQRVAAAPGEFHRISTWTVILDYDGQEVTATGTLDWVPGPSPWGWLAIAALLTAMVVAAVVRLRRPQWALAAATAVLVAADMVHGVGIGLATAGVLPQRIGVFVGAIVGQALAWLIGTFAVVLLARGRLGAVWLAAIAGSAVALTSGLSDLPTLSRSSAPSALPIDAARATIVAALGLGLGLLIALVLVVRRQRRSLVASAAEGTHPGGRLDVSPSPT